MSGHLLPFGTDALAKSIEDYLMDVLRHMDEDLDELANMTVRHVENRARTIENPELKRLVGNLALCLGQRVASECFSQTVRSVSGVGGAANGVGNLVKMGVKQVGKLFGKTFSREVYTQIGKIFTKNVVKTMSVCLQAFVEGAFFAWDACHWQGQLVDRVRMALDDWESEVCKSLDETMLPDYCKTNYEHVQEAYKGMLGVYDEQIAESQKTHSAKEKESLFDDLATLTALSEKLEG